MRAQEIHDQAKIEREELRIEKIQKSRKIEGIKTYKRYDSRNKI